jgi:hypothetical protein
MGNNRVCFGACFTVTTERADKRDRQINSGNIRAGIENRAVRAY